MTKVKTAVIPIAGYGTRFLPATKAIPKTMFPIIDKPVLQYLIEEVASSGIKKVIIITGVNGDIIKRHFTPSPELEATLIAKQKHELLDTVKSITSLVDIEFVEQEEALGDGHAVLCAYDKIKDEEAIAVLFGDDFIVGDTPPIKQLIDTYHESNSPVVGVVEVPRNLVYKYGVVATENDHTASCVTKLVEKPKVEEAPSNKAIVGRYILTKDVIETLNTTKTGSVGDGEIRIADALERHLNSKPLLARTINGTRYDIGSKEGFVKAIIDLGKNLI